MSFSKSFSTYPEMTVFVSASCASSSSYSNLPTKRVKHGPGSSNDHFCSFLAHARCRIEPAAGSSARVPSAA